MLRQMLFLFAQCSQQICQFISDYSNFLKLYKYVLTVIFCGNYCTLLFVRFIC